MGDTYANMQKCLSKWDSPYNICTFVLSTQFFSDISCCRKESISFHAESGPDCYLFLYRHVLKMEIGWIDHVERAKRPNRLRVVFTRREVGEILNMRRI